MAEDWLGRWRDNRIGWHESAGNKSLKKFWRLSGKKVLVPLCGKSLDLLWLRDAGNDVVGVELSELAAQSFFEENDLEYTRSNEDWPVFHGEGITIHCTDFLLFNIDSCDALYDRAALIALPEGTRPDYVDQCNALLAPGSPRLVITLEYDQALANGPPFSVSENELLCYWPDMQELDSYDELDNSPPKFRMAGFEELLERVWGTKEFLSRA